MMPLTILSDWNSLDSVRRAHSDFELGGLVFFALLVMAEALAHTTENKEREHRFNTFGVWLFAIAVLCELVAYPYGQRNDELSAQVIGSLDALAHDADSTAKGAKTTADGAKIKADAVGVEAGQAEIRATAAGRKAAQAGASAANALSTAHDADEVARAVTGRVEELESARFVDCPTQSNGPLATTPKQRALQEVETYSATRVFIQAVPAKEPGNLAKILYDCLLNIGWRPQIMSPPPPNRSIPPGVRIDTGEIPSRDDLYGREFLPELTKSAQAATALKKFLEFDLNPGVSQSANIPDGPIQTTFNRFGFSVPRGVLVIEVGQNPSAPHPNAQPNNNRYSNPSTRP
jgi:hypothetical protein